MAVPGIDHTLDQVFSYQNISETYDFLRTGVDFQINSKLIDLESIDGHTDFGHEIDIKDVKLIDWVPNASPHYKVSRFAVSSKSQKQSSLSQFHRNQGLKAMCTSLLWVDKAADFHSGGIFHNKKIQVLEADGSKYEVQALFRMPSYCESSHYEYQPGWFLSYVGEVYLHLNFFGVSHVCLPNTSTFTKQVSKDDWNKCFFMNKAFSFKELHDILISLLQQNFDLVYHVMSFIPFDPKLIEYNLGIAISEEIHDLIFNQADENMASLQLQSYNNDNLPDTVKCFEPWNTKYDEIPLKRWYMPANPNTSEQ